MDAFLETDHVRPEDSGGIASGRPAGAVSAGNSSETARSEPVRPRSIQQFDEGIAARGDISADDAARIQLAWAKLVWLLSFLAVALTMAYLVPFAAEQTQYAITRGKQRAEYEIASEKLAGSPLEQLSSAYQMISQRVGPSVVHINTLGSAPASITSLSLPGSRTLPRRSPLDGQGSGFVVDADGYIVTNYHVVREAREIRVALSDGRRVVGEVVGVDSETDLAVIRVNADGLIAADWGDSDETDVGALVWAVGSPFGLERSITSGILSAKHRAGLAGTPYQDFLQTDAAVNPGNSGGPLVNARGTVVGVNTAIVGDAYQGISFAVPSNVARDVYERLRREGEVRRGWLGVALDSIGEDRAQELGLPIGFGAYVTQVVNDGDKASPASEAGILAGDIVLRWNDSPIKGPASLSNLVAQTAVGTKAQVVLLREGAEMTLEVAVGQRPRQ
jgi:serine protease Do